MSTMVARLPRFAVLVMILLGLTNPANADIIEISVPVNSQAPQSRPAIDNVWSVASQGGTLPTTLGIGIIVNSSWVSVIDFMDFALHQNPDLGTAPYTGLHFPPLRRIDCHLSL